MNPRPASRDRLQGLTLLELLVVITILAILTTVASRSLLAVTDQAQYDANEGLCRDFRRALLGVPNALQSDGTPGISGLIADLGRPPRAEYEDYVVAENEVAPDKTGKAWTLREVCSLRTAAPFRLYKADASNLTTGANPISISLLTTTNLNPVDTTITVPTGWRGPYLDLSGYSNVLRDSWSKPVAAYGTLNYRTLVNLWVTSYLTTTVSPPKADLSPFDPALLGGYHNVGDAFTGMNFGRDVVGVVIRPGPGTPSDVGNSLSSSVYAGSFNAGVVWTNEYVATLRCALTVLTNRLDPAFYPDRDKYWYMGVVLLYGPNPAYDASVSSPTQYPVGVAYMASATKITTSGTYYPSSTLNTGLSLTLGTARDITFTNYPVVYGSASTFSYPLVQGPKVVRPALVAVLQSSYTPTATLRKEYLFTGPAVNVTLRPGFNSVQVTVP